MKDQKNSETILIVEDEVVIGLDLQSKLQSLGYAVPAVIHYGERVEAAVIKEKPDLILMDIHLKGEMRGTEVGRLISDRYRVPVVFLTAFSDEESLSEAKQANPYGFLKKPVNSDTLKITLEMALYKAQMEQKLRLSEAKFRRIYENSVAGIYQSSAEGRFIMANQAFATMIGYSSPQEVLDLSNIAIQLYVEAADRQLFKQQIEKHGRVENFEFKFHHTDGSERWLSISCHVVNDFAGEFLHYEGVAIDITKRKQAELKLQKNNAQLKQMLNSIAANVCVTDLDTYEILFMNQHMIDDFGEDMTGKTCWECLSHASEPCSDCSNEKLLNPDGEPTGVCSWEHESVVTGRQYLHNDCAIRWIDGRMASLLVATDITEFKLLERKLRQKSKMEAVGIMAGGVAHNFNNNLAIILGNIEMAQIKKTDPEVLNTYLETAKTAIFRSRDLVQQILTYSRQGINNIAPVRIEAVIEETLQLLSATLPSTINLQLKKEKISAGATIRADSSRLHEALLNLCNNAMQAMDEKGDLTIALDKVTLVAADMPAEYEGRTAGAYARISIQDSGCGMDQDILDKIFDPFFTTKDVGKGTGMGLSTVQGIIEQHQGVLKVSSTVGKGSCFELYFPLIEQEEQKRIPESAAILRGTERILFVDDDELLADIVSQMLSELGYAVTAVTSSAKALELFSADPDRFELVITDQTMPKLTGEDLIVKLRQIRPQLPVMLCTGHSTRIDDDKAMQQGINAFLLKPLDLQLLAQSIREVLPSEP